MKTGEKNCQKVYSGEIRKTRKRASGQKSICHAVKDCSSKNLVNTTLSHLNLAMSRLSIRMFVRTM